MSIICLCWVQDEVQMKKFFSRGINYCLVNITNLSSNKWKEVYIPYLYLGLSILLLFYQRLQQHHKEWSRSLQTVTKIKRIQPPTYLLQTPSERGAPPAPCLLGNFSKPRRRRRRPRPRERHQTKGFHLWRSRNQKCENQTDGVGSRTPHPVTTPSLTIRWKLDCRSLKQKRKNKPITMFVSGPCDWLVLPFLLPTPTI